MIPEMTLIRHAEARVQKGSSSIHARLTEQGKRQLRCLRGRLVEIEHAAVYTSHFLRAKLSASALFPDNRLVVDPLLSEMNDGIWDQLDKESVDSLFPFESIRKEMQGQDYRPIGGENILDMNVRAELFLFRLDRTHVKGERIAIVSHGWFITAFLARLGISCPPLINCCAFGVRMRGRKWICKKM